MRILVRIYKFLLLLSVAQYVLYGGILLFLGGAYLYGVSDPSRLQSHRQPSQAAATQPAVTPLSGLPPGNETVPKPMHPILRVIEFAIGGVDWQEHKEKLAREAEARSREARVRQAHFAAETELVLLEAWEDEFRLKLREGLDVSTDGSPVPDKLLLLLAEEESAAEAWSTIRGPKRATRMMQSLRRDVNAVARRIELGTFLDSDREQLEHVEAAVKSIKSTLPEHEMAFEHLKVLFESQQFLRGPSLSAER